jgi:SAM-dependent methyltransferase
MLSGGEEPRLPRRSIVRSGLLAGWACTSGVVLSNALDFPPASFKAVAKDIYVAAQPTAARVLEIGAGPTCSSVFDQRFCRGSEAVITDLALPSEDVLRDAQARADADGYSVSFQRADATSLPFADSTFDTVVCSLTLCSVSSLEAAVAEVHRVLKRGGTFGFIEHVRVLESDRRPILGLSQILLDPLQQAIAHNCHLRRDSDKAIVDAFGGQDAILRLDRMENANMWPVSQLAAGVVFKQS